MLATYSRSFKTTIEKQKYNLKHYKHVSRLFRTSRIFARTHITTKKPVVRVLFVVLALTLFAATFAIYPYTRSDRSARVYAATNGTINFQARILTAGGAVIPDGSYNVRFKIYDGGTSGGPAGQGAANSGTGGVPLWTETWQNSASNGIVTKNGYITATLGSITAFSGVNWDQELWITMDVGGTSVGASPTYDGEMLMTGSKRMRITATPYSLAAGKLQTTSGSLSSSLSITAPTVGNQTFVLQDQAAAGTYNICIQNSSSCGFLKKGAQDTSTLGTLTAGQYLYGFSNTSATASGVLSLSNGASSTGNTLYVASSGNPAAGSALIVANAATGVTGNLIDLQLNAVSKFSVNQAGNVIAAGTITSGAVNGLTLTSAADGFTVAGGTTSRTLTVTGANITVGSTITPTAAGALAVSANGANNLSLDGGTTGAVNINGSSSGDVNIAGGSGTTGCTVTNSTGALTCTAGITSNNNTINSQTLSSTALTFTGANPTISPSTANTGITLQANGTGALTLGGISTASNTINVGTAAGNTFTQTVNIGTSATAGSTTNVNIGSTVAGTTTLQGLLAISGGTNNGVYYRNSSGNVVTTAAGTTGQCLQGVTGAAPSWSACLSAEADTLATVTSRGATTATATSFTGGLTVSNGAATAIAVTSNATVPTADQLSIINTGSTGVTTAGVNGLSIAYKGGAAAVEAAGARVDLTPGTTSGGTWSGVRVVPNATGAVAGVTENALKIDTLTTPGAGTENAISVGTGWDAVLSYNGTVLINGTGIVQSGAVSGSYTGITGVGTITVGTWNGTQIGAVYGGTGQTTTTTGDLLVGAAGNTWNKVAAVASGSCLISQGVGVAPIWGACGATNIVQAPANTAQNTITPTTTGTVGLTVNSTSFATGGATALIVNQTATAATAVDGADININNATNPVTNGLLINKTGAGTITSLLNLTQGAGTTTNGIIFNGTITNDITTAAARALTVVTGTTGALSLDTGTTGAINIGTNANNKTIQIGAGTGTAASSTVNIANSASAAQTVTIGSTNGASALTLQGGTGNINLSTNSSSASVIVKTSTNSATAFQVQNASGTSVLAVDTTNQTVKVRSLSDAASLGANLFSNSCTGANWSGANPYTHTAGSTTLLTCTVPSITAGATYEVAYTTAGTTAGEYFTPSMGGANGPRIYGDATGTVVLTTTTTANMTIAPTSAQTGSFTITSVKLVTNASTPLTVLDSTGTTRLEVRVTTYNTALGMSSLQSNTTGSRNTAVGTISLQSNTTGSDNAGFGYAALQNNTTGINNTATGSYALYSNMSGSNNTANGQNALSNNSSGYYNSAFGASALNTNNVGIQNTGIGASALAANTSGSNNTAVGYASQSGGTTTSNNTSVGYNSLQNATGSYNTAVGTSTFTGTISGVNNTALGFNAGTSNGGFTQVTNVDNATAIGAYALVQASNSLVLGQIPTPTNVGIGTTIPLNTFSVSPVDYAVGTISQTASATVVGSGTTFTAAMVGDQLIYADGTTDTVTAFTDATHITVTTSRTHGSSAYRLHYIGLQVKNNGTAYVQGNSATQLQVKNGNTKNVLTVDSANGQVILGNSSAGGVNGALVFNNTTNTNAITLVAGASASNFSLTLPTTAGSSNDCLKNSGTAGVLTFGSCASSITLQAAYNSSAGATPSIAVNTTNKAVVVQNSVTSGIAAGNEYFGVRATGASDVVYGNSIFTVNSAGIGINIGGTGNPATSYDLSLGGSANRTIGVEGATSGGGSKLTILGAAGAANSAGGDIQVQAGSTGGGASGSGITAGSLTFLGGAGNATNSNGGNITFTAGAKNAGGTGTSGQIVFKPAASNDNTVAVQFQNAAGSRILNVDTVNQTLSVTNKLDSATLGAELATGTTCSGTNWSGAGPWTHTVGSTTALTCTVPASVTNGAYYQLTYTVASSTAGSVTPTVGGNSGQATYGNTTDVQTIQTVATTGITIAPTTDFNGQISAISLKLITNTTSALSVNNAANSATVIEVRGGGTGNQFTGVDSGINATSTAQANTSDGYRSLRRLTTGIGNSAYGYGTMAFLTSGSYNSGFGSGSLNNLTNGSNNTASGYFALQNTSSGSDNTAIGYNALTNNLIGSNNTAVGSGANVGYTGLSYATAIGSNANVSGSNSIVLGRTITNGGTGDAVGINTNTPALLANTAFQVGTGIYTTGTLCQNTVACGGAGAATTTVTGVGTTFTANMVGGTIIYSDGSTATITAFTSTTSMTVSVSKYIQTATGYTIVYPGGFNISNTGVVTSRNLNNSTTAFQVQNAAGTSVLNVDTTNGNLLINGVVPTTNAGTVTSGSVSANPWSLVKQGNYLYNVKNGTAMQIIDATDPTSMVVKSTFTVTGATALQSIVVQGHYAYVTDFSATKFFVIDVTNPTSPTLVTTVTAANAFTDMVVVGNYAYAITTNRNILIYDISNPLNPLLKSTTASAVTAGSPLGIVVKGNYLYLTGSNGTNGKLFIYDISNPSAPSLRNGAGATLNTTSPKGGVVVGRYMYVYNNTTAASLEIFDISDPTTTAAHTGTVNLTAGAGGTNSSPQMVVVQGNYAYVTNYTASKMEIVNITNPATPTLTGSVTTDSNPVALVVDGRYAYVEAYTAGSIMTYNIGGTYSQALDAGNINVDDLRVLNNTDLGGNLSVTGGATIGQSLQVNDDLGVSGNATFYNSTNSSTAFQVKNANGVNQIQVDNTNTNGNLATVNPSGESGTTGWNPRASTTVTQDNSAGNVYYGAYSIKGALGAVSGAGINYPYTATAGVNVNFSFMMKIGTAGTATVGYAYNGVDETTYTTSCTGAGGTGWWLCAISVTPSTVSGSPYLFIKFTDAVGRNIWIDGLRIYPSIFSGGNQSYQDAQINLGSAATPVVVGVSPANIPVNPNASLFVQQTRDKVGLVVQASPENDLSLPDTFRVEYPNDTTQFSTQAVVNQTYVRGGNSFWQTAALLLESIDTNAPALRVAGTYTAHTGNIVEVKENTASAPELTVSSNLGSNLLSNGNFETNTTGWAQKGTATLTRLAYTTALPSFNGSFHMSIATTAANSGAQFAYTFATNTTYSLTMTLRGLAAYSTIAIGRQDNGSNADCLTGQSVTSTGWTTFTCSFTTGGTIGSSNVYVYDTTTGHTLYIDDVRLVVGTNGGGSTSLNGGLNINSTYKGAKLVINDPYTSTTLQNAEAVITASNTTSVALILQSANASAVNAFQYQRFDGSVMFAVTGGDGRLASGSTASGNNTQITSYVPAASDYIGLRVSGAPTQTEDLLQVGTRANGDYASIFNVGVGNADTNIVTNSGIETNTTGYAQKGTATLSRVSTQHYMGSYSLSVVTGAANSGAQYAYTPSASTTYTVSMRIKAAATYSTIVIGRQDNGANIDCLTAQTVTTSWKQFSCTYTTGGTIGTANIYAYDTTTAHTLYIDQVSLVAGTSPWSGGEITFDADITSPLAVKPQTDSNNVFQVQSAAGTALLSVDSSNGNKSVNIGIDSTATTGGAWFGTGFTKTLVIGGTAQGSSNCGGNGVNLGCPVVLLNANGAAGARWGMGIDGNGSFDLATENAGATTTRLMLTNAGLLSVSLNGAATGTAVCSSLGAGAAAAANTMYQIRDCTAAPTADYAEMYPVAAGSTYGDIVSIGTNMVNTYGQNNGEVDWNNVIGQVTQLIKTTQPNQNNTIGVVSDNYGDFTSAGHNIKDSDNPMPVALNGRVPVKISASSSPINAGDYITTSADPGKGQKAVGAGFVIGKALESWTPASGKATIMVYVEQGYYQGPTPAGTLQGSDLSITGNAVINGSLSIGADMSVNGLTTLSNLTVNGNAVFNGNLTVQNIQVANITVNGHIITAGNVPVAAVGTAAGVADPLNSIAAPSVTITGNDTSGTITIVAGASTTADELAKITFDKPFANKPRVVFSPANRDSTKLGAYYDAGAATSTSFSIFTDQAPQAGKTYQFTYFIVE